MLTDGAFAMTIQVLAVADGWMARWLDAARTPPAIAATTPSSADHCAGCWRPSGHSAWAEREVDAALVPAPIMWSWCAPCGAATWYASLPRDRFPA